MFFFFLFFPPLLGRLPFCLRSSVCPFFCNFVSVDHKYKQNNKKPKQKKFEGPGRSRTSGSARAPAVRDVRGTETVFFFFFCVPLMFFFPFCCCFFYGFCEFVLFFVAGSSRARVVQDVRRGAGPGGPGRTGAIFFNFFALFGFCFCLCCSFCVSLGCVVCLFVASPLKVLGFFLFFLSVLCLNPQTQKTKKKEPQKQEQNFRARPVQDFWLCADVPAVRDVRGTLVLLLFVLWFLLGVFAAARLRARVVRDVRLGAGPGGPGRTGAASFFFFFWFSCVGGLRFCLLSSVCLGFVCFFFLGGGARKTRVEQTKRNSKKKRKKTKKQHQKNNFWKGTAGAGRPTRRGPRRSGTSAEPFSVFFFFLPFFGFLFFCFFWVFFSFVFFLLLVGYGPGWSPTSGEARAPAVQAVPGRPFPVYFSSLFPPCRGSFAVLSA